MTKTELIAAYAEAAGKPKDMAGKELATLFRIIKSSVIKKEFVILPENIGTLKPVTRAPKRGRNPRTGEEIFIDGRKSVKLVISRAFANELNG